jgi:hypothetical protein
MHASGELEMQIQNDSWDSEMNHHPRKLHPDGLESSEVVV